MKTGIKFADASFQKATETLVRGARSNTLAYGKTIAAQFVQDARQEAPWTDRRGNARRHFEGKADLSGNVVKVAVGGSAPNYKRGRRSSPDYMEYLEFDYERRYAVIYPVVKSMENGIVRGFGVAALRGAFRMRIQRDKGAAKRRRAWHKANPKKSRMRGVRKKAGS